MQEYLEVQRQLAIQRLQEQEKERQMRLEQQKQTVQMRAQMPAFPLPYAQACVALPTLSPRTCLTATYCLCMLHHMVKPMHAPPQLHLKLSSAPFWFLKQDLGT